MDQPVGPAILEEEAARLFRKDAAWPTGLEALRREFRERPLPEGRADMAKELAEWGGAAARMEFARRVAAAWLTAPPDSGGILSMECNAVANSWDFPGRIQRDDYEGEEPVANQMLPAFNYLSLGGIRSRATIILAGWCYSSAAEAPSESMMCPSCRSPEIAPSRPKNIFERLLRVVHLRHYRCMICGTRFIRSVSRDPRKPPESPR